jgi:predicted transcriptional regulator
MHDIPSIAQESPVSKMSHRLPPLNGLRSFEAAARHLSFTRAADELRVTPRAVSQQVKSERSASRCFDVYHAALS